MSQRARGGAVSRPAARRTAPAPTAWEREQARAKAWIERSGGEPVSLAVAHEVALVLAAESNAHNRSKSVYIAPILRIG